MDYCSKSRKYLLCKIIIPVETVHPVMTLSLIAKQQPQAIAKLYKLKQEVFKDGALTAREKELIAVSLACVMKCDTCLETHALAAMDLGATCDEIREAMLVAMYLTGPAAVIWSPLVDQILSEEPPFSNRTRT